MKEREEMRKKVRGDKVAGKIARASAAKLKTIDVDLRLMK